MTRGDLQQTQHMFDAVQGLFFSQQGRNLENARSEFSAYEHDTQGEEKISRFDGGGCRHDRR